MYITRIHSGSSNQTKYQYIIKLAALIKQAMPCASCREWVDEWIDWTDHERPSSSQVHGWRFIAQFAKFRARQAIGNGFIWYLYCSSCDDSIWDRHRADGWTPGYLINEEGCLVRDENNYYIISRMLNKPRSSYTVR